MILVSLTDSCRLLVVDPKTLRCWLHQAHFSVQPHLLDARLKCITSDQLQQVAVMHRRILASPDGLRVPAEPFAFSPACTSVGSAVSAPLTDLSNHLVDLQAQVATFHHQIALLTEQIHSIQSQDKPSVKSQDKPSVKSQDKPSVKSQDKPLVKSQDKPLVKSQDKPLVHASSTDRRRDHHVLPVVEYGVDGTYVLISPEQGKLSFEPDSPEWFAWLSTLPSFRFVGQQGRFTAFRGYQRTPNTPWWAHRQIHSHSHKHRLGITASVTIASLELAASSLQAFVK